MYRCISIHFESTLKVNDDGSATKINNVAFSATAKPESYLLVRDQVTWYFECTACYQEITSPSLRAAYSLIGFLVAKVYPIMDFYSKIAAPPGSHPDSCDSLQTSHSPSSAQFKQNLFFQWHQGQTPLCFILIMSWENLKVLKMRNTSFLKVLINVTTASIWIKRTKKKM